MQRYVIVGTGAAGIAAAEAIRCLDGSGSILLVGDESYGYYSRPGLAYFLTGELPESQLYPFNENDFRRLNLRRLHDRAVRILPQSRQVELQSGQVLPYDRLLVATGARAAGLQVPGGKAEGIVKLDSLDDARLIIRLARRARSAVVVGGGITALEIVEGLIARRVKVHYFLRGDRYWSNVLDEIESRIVEQRLREEGVTIHYHTELAEVLSRRGRVSAVRTKDGRQIACEIVAVAIGVSPRLELAQASGLEIERGVLVSEQMQTSAAGVFAAGDVAQVFDPFTGASVLDTLWGPARDQGTIAGLNMAGQSGAYYKLVPFNVTRLASLTTTIIGKVGRGRDEDLLGIARGDSETWRQLPDVIAAQSNFAHNRLRMLVGERSLVGAIIMGDQTLSRPIHTLIAHQADISRIRDRLLNPNAPLGDIIADFWTETRDKSQYAAQQS